MHCELRRNRLALRVRIAAVVCVLAWFASIPTMLPMLLAALGPFDHQHRAAFETRLGQVALVLHHHAGAAAARHSHELPARILAAFAIANDEQPDHVISFDKVGAAKLSAAIMTPVVAVQLAPPIADTWTAIPSSISSEVPAFAAHLPPTGAFTLVCLRSTTLRI